MGVQTQRKILRKDFSGPVCAKKFIAIGRPYSVDSEKEAKRIALRCDRYGEPTEFTGSLNRIAVEITVAFPDPIASSVENPDYTVTHCGECINYVGASATEEKLGWNSAFCKAKGALILVDRLDQYAPKCSYRASGNSGIQSAYYRTEILNGWDPKLLPEHQIKLAASSPTEILRSRRAASVDPDLYPTDRPVGPRAAAMGVRAWRRIRDQREFGPDIFLPVFDIKNMTEMPSPDWRLETEIKKIPRTQDQERPGDYIDHGNFVYRVGVAWTRLAETPAIWGPAGVGKTELFRHLAWLMRLPFERISITGSSELDDIAGKMMFIDNETVFQYGRVPRAWGKPNVLCIDEPNVGPPEIWQFLRPLTDNSKQLVLDQSGGERIDAHTACYLGMAMNPAWDPRNVGAMELGDADGSRLLHVHMGYPPQEIEVALLAERLRLDRSPRLDEEDLRREEARENEVIKTLMEIAKDLRGLANNGSIPISWGVRHQIKVARLKKYMSWVDAFRAGAVDALQPEQGELILTSVKSHCPEGE